MPSRRRPLVCPASRSFRSALVVVVGRVLSTAADGRATLIAACTFARPPACSSAPPSPSTTLIFCFLVRRQIASDDDDDGSGCWSTCCVQLDDAPVWQASCGGRRSSSLGPRPLTHPSACRHHDKRARARSCYRRVTETTRQRWRADDNDGRQTPIARPLACCTRVGGLHDARALARPPPPRLMASSVGAGVDVQARLAACTSPARCLRAARPLARLPPRPVAALAARFLLRSSPPSLICASSSVDERRRAPTSVDERRQASVCRVAVFCVHTTDMLSVVTSWPSDHSCYDMSSHPA